MNLEDLGRFIERLPFASIDHLRPATQGHQEVILCQGKTPEQAVAIAERLEAAAGSFLATRADGVHRVALAARFSGAEVNELGRTVYLPPTPEPEPTGRGTILIVTAGTSDLPVAEEAAVTARAFRNRVARLTDVGVAGIHRILTQTDLLRSAAVIVVVAGMEGRSGVGAGDRRTHERRLRSLVRRRRRAARHAQLLRGGRHRGQHRQRVRRRRRREPHQSLVKGPRAGVWVGRGLAVLGLAAVIPAVLSANGWALVAALGGFVAATGLALGPLVRVWLADEPLTKPSDFHHTLDLLRRAHGARAGWAVGLDDSEVEVLGRDRAARLGGRPGPHRPRSSRQLHRRGRLPVRGRAPVATAGRVARESGRGHRGAAAHRRRDAARPFARVRRASRPAGIQAARRDRGRRADARRHRQGRSAAGPAVHPAGGGDRAAGHGTRDRRAARRGGVDGRP